LQIPTLPKTLSFGSATVLRRKPNESAVKLGSIWLAACSRRDFGRIGRVWWKILQSATTGFVL
jgi:hypothetical protein